MISNLKYDIEFRREKALELSSQVEKHMAAGGRFSRAEPAPINPGPAKRSETIDPDTILKRRRPSVPHAERIALRRMADSI